MQQKKELEEGAIKLGVGQLVDKTAPQIMEDFAPGMKEYSIDFEIPESIKIDQMMPEPIVQNETKLEEDVK